MLEQRVRRYRSGIKSAINNFWLRCPFTSSAPKYYCEILQTHHTLYKTLQKIQFPSNTIRYVRATTSGPATLPTATSSHPATNRRRSPATRHDAPAATSPATAADPSRGRQSWLDFRPIHQQAQTTSFRKPPTPAANGAAASSKPSCTATRATSDAGTAGAAGSYHTGGTRSEGVGTGKVAERAGFEAANLYIEWTEEGDVQR